MPTGRGRSSRTSTHDCVLWIGRTRTSFARPDPRRRWHRDQHGWAGGRRGPPCGRRGPAPYCFLTRPWSHGDDRVPDVEDAVDAELVGGRLRQVEGRAVRVRPTIDDRDGHRAATVDELDLRPARKRLVG